MMNKELKPESALDSLFIYQEEFQKILGYENVPFEIKNIVDKAHETL